MPYRWLGPTLFAIAYAVCSLVVWQISPATSYSTLIAPQAGVAVAALSLLGVRYWPGLLALGWITPALHGLAPLACLELDAIQALQALLTLSLLPQFAHDGGFRLRDALRFLVAGPLVSALLGASFSAVVLGAFQHGLPGGAPEWLTLWLGDAFGMITVLPLCYALRQDALRIRANWLIELVLLICVGAVTAMLVYRHFELGYTDMQFLLFPLVICTALRLGHIGNGSVLLVVGAIALVQLSSLGVAGAGLIPVAVVLVTVAIAGMVLAASHHEEAVGARRARLAAQVFHNATEGILITDANARIIAVNPAFSQITGYESDESLGKISRMFHKTGPVREVNRDMLSELATQGRWQGEMLDRRKTGEAYPAWLSISAVRDDNGAIANYVGVFSDYTHRKEAEQRLFFLANHDALTALHNRVAMNEALQQAVARAGEEDRQLALLFIDLDRFKGINDTLGHDVGDELLKVIAQRLRGTLKETQLIARLGGDEFTILIDNVRDADEVAHVAERVLAELSRAVVIKGQELFVTCSIGISLYPGDGNSPAQLLKNADVAMYRAKELGKNNFQFFAPDMNARAFEHLVLENSLRYALERRELVLHFQPQIDLATGELSGVECLIRWEHPELGLVPPSSFIPLAEENGLIVPIGEWVLQEGCRMMRLWQVAGYHIPRMAINLSARQFQREQLAGQVRNALESSGIAPELLELEITESMIMQNPHRAVAVLEELKRMGVQLAIDDFGTGYSSLSNLKHFPLDTLKIDRSFTVGLPDDSDSAAITEAIVAMARKLRLKVVAEGVETVEQMLFMRRAGAHAVQGYLYAPAMDADSLLRYLLREGFAAASSGLG